MKKPIIAILLLLSFTANAQKNPAKVKPNPYYKVKLTKVATLNGLAIQAFATGRHDDTLLLFSGRTNGFHNFPTPPVASFPSNRSNDSIAVYIPSKNKLIKAGILSLLTPIATTANPNPVPTITTDQVYQLASTNMQSCQNGDTLYCMGGYGYNGNMVTFGGCFAINVPRMIRLILDSGSVSSATIKKAICFATNKDTTNYITGGELLKTNNSYYLVVGQLFNGEYSNGAYAASNPTGYVQNYWSKIVPYSFNWTNDTTFTTSVGPAAQNFNILHRRDLNVVPVINSKGTKSIHIYGGVFTPTAFGGPYVNPVEITDSTGSLSYTQNNMVQHFNQYAAAHISMFDTRSNKMFTTILGGITLYDSVRNSQNNAGLLPVPPATTSSDTSMPWSSIVSTMMVDNNAKTITEYASDDVRLPGLIGGEAKFIAFKQYLMAGSDEIVDMAKVKAAAKKNRGIVQVGIMFGGIVSQFPITQTRSQTQSNPNVYAVNLGFPVGEF